MTTPATHAMHKAVFLDRDGTLNEEINLLCKSEDLRLLPGAGKAVAKLNQLGYQVIVITNQPVVARGLCSEENVREIHEALRKIVEKEGGKIDAFYYCPHSKLAEVEKYRVACDCRKPGIGMLKAAEKAHNLDLKASFLVGDMTRDILAGKNAGCRTILVKTGYAGLDKQFEVKPDFTCKDLAEAAALIARQR